MNLNYFVSFRSVPTTRITCAAVSMWLAVSTNVGFSQNLPLTADTQRQIEFDDAGLDDDFGLSDEERRALLRCPRDTIPVPLLPPGETLSVTEYPIELEADEVGTDAGSVVLSGDAEVVQGNQAIKAEKLIYRKEQDRLDAVGNVVIYTPLGDRIEADRMDIELETFIGEADNARFSISERNRLLDNALLGTEGEGEPTLRELLADDDASDLLSTNDDADDATPGESKVRARGTAKKAYFEGHDVMRLSEVEYTTCLEGQEDVVIAASEVELDKGDNVGVARNVRIKFMDVPIFYVPYLSFPISSERKTGFLFPGIGRQDDAGIVIEAPWYWNIAPNIDATIVPRYYQDRGTQIAAEVRYLTETSEGHIRGEVLPNDDLENGEDRNAWSFRHRQEFSDRLIGNINYQDASDERYFDDFDTDVEITSATHLPRTADLTYYGDVWQFGGQFHEYLTVDEDAPLRNRPYERLPQLYVTGTVPFDNTPLEFGLDAEWTNFERDDSLTGTRLDLSPSISLPLRDVYGFVVPRVGYRLTNYSLDNVESANLTDDSPSRGVPVLSVDSGLYFDRATSWGGRDHIQSLEPRLFYTYIPNEDQDDLPVFDTSEVNFDNFSDIFRENRFQGADRVGDTSQLTVALTTRLFDDISGVESLTASVGQILFLDDREVTLRPVTDDDNTDDEDANDITDTDSGANDDANTRSTSDILMQLDARFNKYWEANSFLRYDSDESEIGYGRFAVRYQENVRKLVELGYSYAGDSSEQIDLRMRWPLTHRWDLQVRENYDISRSEHQETTVSLGYEACCWGIDFTFQRRVSRRDDYKNSFFVVFELTGLGRLRSAF